MSKHATPISRRAALAAGLAPLVVPRHILGGTGFQAPSDTLAIAAVGIGGMGRNYLEGCAGERIVALCDVHHTYAAPVLAKYPEARRHIDFREMLDKEVKSFDALIIGTPDHTHAVIQHAALALKKHIYSAKPLTHTIGEARRLREAVRKAGVITQTSVQSCASEESCGTAEILLAGVLGPVREVHVWTPHPIYPCSLLRPEDAPPVPEGLTWDLWIGPAPFRPYHSAYHPFAWRAWWDFGSGTVGDMGCHTFHCFYRPLRLAERPPRTIYGYRSQIRLKGRPEIVTPECESHANMVTWEFPGLGDLPPLAVHWYDGGMRPMRPEGLDPRTPMPDAGLLFVGAKGTMLSGFAGGRDLLLPEERFRGFQRPARTLPRTIGHYLEWTRGCKTGAATSCPMDFGSELTEMALLGTLAIRTGRLLQWDASARQITNDPEADRLVDPPYRAGWSI